jgi:hypothetical protein
MLGLLSAAAAVSKLAVFVAFSVEQLARNVRGVVVPTLNTHCKVPVDDSTSKAYTMQGQAGNMASAW